VRILQQLIFMVCGLVLFSSPVAAQNVRVTLRSVALVPQETVDQHGEAFTIVGLSGISYMGGDAFIAVMDNSSRLVQFEMQFHDDGRLASLDCIGGIRLSERRDFEGIVYVDEDPPSVLLSEEDTPGVRRYRLDDGALLETLTTPPIYRSGMRPNLGFESLTAGPGTLWTANEEALSMDGDRSSETAGSLVRLLRFDRHNGSYLPAAQLPYLTEPIHKAHSDRDRRLSRNGLVELVALSDGRLLALERSFALFGPGNVFSDFKNSIFLVDPARATDVSGPAFDRGLQGHDVQPVGKTPLWSLRGLKIGNLEGLCLGPQLGGGRWALVGVTDSGGMPGLVSRVVVFELQVG
jgi:hypothetical protein